jgi:hypothetical protein
VIFDATPALLLQTHADERGPHAWAGMVRRSMLDEYNNNVMMQCKVCARTFYEEAYRKHVKGCSHERPYPKRG